MTAPLVWVVGSGGMLGSHVESVFRSSSADIWVPGQPVPWHDTSIARSALMNHQRRFLAAADGRPWQVLWCAGAGVTASTADDLDREVEVFASFMAGLARAQGMLGSVFLASSAGGLYAGSAPAPFDEFVTPRPLSPYGQAKLRMEQIVREWAHESGGRGLVGRLANLFGPGQDVAKPQGLVTHLLRAHLTRVPLTIYVPLDTMRDYIYVRDAADRVVVASAKLRGSAPGQTVTKIIASQQALTVAAVIGELRRMLHRKPEVVLGVSPLSQFQAVDLRLRSAVWSDLDARPVTPFCVGAHMAMLDLVRQLGSGRLGAA